ncbi:26 kda polypeptide [Potato aucuba mosaic virus]|uniref:26 kDa polypeptide protein n=1 Tax=Potato aucuba mosaic virus TaxID=12182 RepID=Q86822_PAMV|nr:26 kDa protein [Potato aucuba mosaic virus]AAB32332.1 26 kda polypeptide [Potato aucuba mosaic virus]
MEYSFLVRLLDHYGFERTTEKIVPGQPIVVQGIAGCGKTTLLRNFHQEYPSIPIYSCFPQKISENSEELQLLAKARFTASAILDEYLAHKFDYQKCLAVFADPLQYSHLGALRPHYQTSKHIGLVLVLLILSLRNWIPIESLLSEEKTILKECDPYATDPIGQIIASNHEVLNYIKPQAVEAICSCEVLGKEFQTVSCYYQSHKLEDSAEERRGLYIAISRAKSAVLLFDLD